jgi:hypothetical protein
MKVFLSYAHDDTSYARLLTDALQRRGVEILDFAAIPAGASVATAIHRMIEDADAFVLLISRSSAASPSVDREIAAAVARAAHDRSVRLIPVKLDERAEVSPLVSHYIGVAPETAKDVNRTAAMIHDGLTRSVGAPDLDLERVVIQEQQAYVASEAARWAEVRAVSWTRLSWVVGVVGLGAGVAGAIAAASVIADGRLASALLTLVSIAAASVSAAAALYSWRSRNDR